MFSVTSSGATASGSHGPASAIQIWRGTGFGASIFGTKTQQQISLPADYQGLVIEIATFFKTRQPPISEDETIEIFAFIEAADESKRQGGVPVTLASVMEAAGSVRGR